MAGELKDLRINREQRRNGGGGRKWIALAGALVVALAGGGWAWTRLNAPIAVETARVKVLGGAQAADSGVILNANGYIVAAHKIEVSSKVVGKIAWIGVDKGDHVKEGQVLVRLEDEEYRAQLTQARGQLASLEARLAEAVAGSRPEEIAEARANWEQAIADLENAKISLSRAENLAGQGVVARQALDDAKARYDAQAARVASLQKRYDLVRLGPRKEQVDALRGQVEQARGMVAFAETQLANTVIKAPVSGTILERAVEKGEFLTTSFVGERGAKGYVVSLADLNDLEVELDISQNDFAKLGSSQRGTVTTDAYPDRKYEGIIRQISPEANRQKATVQVKVKIVNPDAYLRPDMNASVAFLAGQKAGAPEERIVVTPASAVRDGAVFVVVEGKAVRRAVKTGPAMAQGVRIEQGLNGGEDVIVNPPADLRDGARVRAGGNP